MVKKQVLKENQEKSCKLSMIELIPMTARFVQALVHVVDTHLEAGQPLPRVGCVLKFTKK